MLNRRNNNGLVSYNPFREMDNFERDFSEALNLIRVSAPLMVVPESGLNDNLNGFERPVHFDVLYLKKNEIVKNDLNSDWVKEEVGRTGVEPGFF